MNVKISYDTKFLAGICWDDNLLMNQYQISIDMLVNTADPVDQNVALLRIRHLLEEQLQNSYFVKKTDQDTIERLQLTGIKFSELPEQPIDQIIGIILSAKFSAVTENRLLIKAVKISSLLGDNVTYIHDDDTEAFAGPTLWWNHAGSHVSDIVSTGSDNRDDLHVLRNTKRWKELGLHWSEDEDTCAESSNILIFNEHHDDTDNNK